MHAKTPAGLISAPTISPWLYHLHSCSPNTSSFLPLSLFIALPLSDALLSLPVIGEIEVIVYSPPLIFSSLCPPFLRFLFIHPSKHNQRSLSSTSFHSLSLSFSFASLTFSLPVSDSRSFKFMLMIFPNLISESGERGRLYWALKVIGLQVSHTVAFPVGNSTHWATRRYYSVPLNRMLSVNTRAHMPSCCGEERDGGRERPRR